MCPFWPYFAASTRTPFGAGGGLVVVSVPLSRCHGLFGDKPVVRPGKEGFVVRDVRPDVLRLQ
jgi:hypothetical protein